MSTETFAEWFSGYSYRGELPTFIQFYEPKYTDSFHELDKKWGEIPNGVLRFDSKEAQEILNKPFVNEFGSVSHPFFEAWSGNYVYYVHEYDGKTSLSRVLRNPPK